jgi:hypothetical protein
MTQYDTASTCSELKRDQGAGIKLQPQLSKQTVQVLALKLRTKPRAAGSVAANLTCDGRFKFKPHTAAVSRTGVVNLDLLDNTMLGRSRHNSGIGLIISGTGTETVDDEAAL